MSGRFRVFGELEKSLERNRVRLQSGDVLVVSTKYASNSEGRIINLTDVHISEAGMQISRRFALEPRTAEIILRESEEILGGMAGFVLAMSVPPATAATPPPPPKNTLQNVRYGWRQGTSAAISRPAYDSGILAPNAGIDTSNAREGTAILYPESPYRTAEMLRRRIFLNMGVMTGIILADSRLMPARVGTTGVAVAYAGLEPVHDNRAKPDLDGNPLKVTFQATADTIATIANHAMGEGNQSCPFAIVRDSGAVLTNRRASPSNVAVPPGQCVYVRGLSGYAQ